MQMLVYSYKYAFASDCEMGVDMIFVMGSIDPDNFTLMKNLTIDITDEFVIGPERTQVGWINFDSNATVIFNLSSYQTKSSLHSAIREITYSGGGTDIGDGLLALHNHGFVPSAGARNNFDIPEVAIVVTDGQSPIGSIQEAAALLRRDRNIDMFVVGVGDGIEYDQLEAVAAAGIACDPSRNIFTLTGFDEEELSQLQATLRARICSSELHCVAECTMYVHYIYLGNSLLFVVISFFNIRW